LKYTLARCIFSTSQHLLAAYEIEAYQCVEFTKGSSVVATIDQMDSANYEASGNPFAWLLVSWA
jgi:hypothetical protein